MINLNAILLLALITTPVFAEVTRQDPLQIHGFASQAYVHTSDNKFFGDSDHGSFDFTELGINASYQLSPRIRLAGQLLSRRAGEFYNGSPWLDYALADINLSSTPQHQFGIYLGRIKNPIGLYNETRDVAHTRQGVFAPQVIYFDKVRNLVMAADGLQFYSNHFLSSGNVLIQVGAGYPIPDKNVEYAYMGQDWQGNLDKGKPGLFGRIMYEHDGGRWVYALTGTRIELDFNHGVQDAIPFPAGAGLSSGTMNIDYTVLSTQYNAEKWQFTTEAAFEHVSYNNIGSAFNQAGFDSFGIYGQLDYKFNSRWQAFIRYEQFQLNIDDWNGKQAARESLATSIFLSGLGINQPPSPAHNNYSKAWILGGHWDISSNLRLRAEYHFVEGTAILSPRENNMPFTEKYWNMFAMSLSYRF